VLTRPISLGILCQFTSAAKLDRGSTPTSFEWLHFMDNPLKKIALTPQLILLRKKISGGTKQATRTEKLLRYNYLYLWQNY
jgi:hypothetical protein